ncbi:MAG: sigma-70 family RNA polymerase sigma factor [Nitrospirae bacterium]|nr:sigma-70 family RNA polymerase sigma factor [Nitrospirota bacterium]
MDPSEPRSKPPGPPADDLEIIRQVLDGRTEAFEALIRRYQDRIFGFCMATLSHRQEAEEAAQEVFLKAFRSLSTFRREANFSTWLYRVAVNECRDALRRRARRRERSWEELVEKHGDALGRMLLHPPAVPPDENAEEAIDGLFSCLRPEDRSLLVLREREGLSYAEMARTLNCSVDAVKARLKRARHALRVKTRHFSG